MAYELSIIIPTYNRRDSLLRTLDALTHQSFSSDKYEVIVVSDGATDGTAEAVGALETPYALRFVEQANAGPSAARNHGARLASAPLIVYVDDDIEPCGEFLGAHAAAHTGDEMLVLIGPQSGPTNEPTVPWIEWEHRMLQKQYTHFIDGSWGTGPHNLYSGNFSVRREHLLGIGGFNEEFTRQEDVELGYRLEKRGLHFRFEAQAGAVHRPTRTFASWYKTPFEYGKRDIQMARAMSASRVIGMAKMGLAHRARSVQLVARYSIGVPIVESTIMAVGRVVVQHGSRKQALQACSLLFNLRYLQGMCRELGGRRKLWETIAR